MPVLPSNLRGALMALLAFGLYSTNDVIIKFLGGTYSLFQTIFFSTVLSFPVMALMMLSDRTDGNLIPKHPYLAVVRAILIMMNVVVGFYAFSVLPLSQCYPIFFATPILITILAIPALGERVGIRRGLAVLVGLVGVLVVLRPGSGHLGLGHLAAIAGAVLGSLNAILIRKTGPTERFAVMMLYPMMANFVMSAIALPFVYLPMPIRDLGLLGAMAGIGMVASVFLIGAYRNTAAVVVAPMQYSQIIWATLYGTVIFHEVHDFWTVVGTSIIIASGVYIVLREDKPAVSRMRPVLETPAQFNSGLLPRLVRWRLGSKTLRD